MLLNHHRASCNDFYAASRMASRAANDNAAPVSQVIDELHAKIAKLEAHRERMKKLNSLVRNKNTKALRALGYSESEILRLLHPDCVKHCEFFRAYKFRNNFEKLRALKEQVKVLESSTERFVERFGARNPAPCYLYDEDAAQERISLYFQAKPEKNVRNELHR